MIDVSIIMPVRNERSSILAAIDSALRQTVEATLEVLAVDGDSDDGTRALLDAKAAQDSRLRVLTNPRRLAGSALNLGLAEARGKYWVRLDGHSELPPNYVSLLMAHLRSEACEAAGGVVKGLGHSRFGRASAAVLDSRFGIGDARHHYATAAEYVDHVSHGMYDVERSRSIGGIDETLLRNEDYDFDYRYRQAGGRIMLEPEAQFVRGVRETPAQLARQFHAYGYWKYIVLRRYPQSLHLRWLAPPALVAGLAIAPLGWVTGRRRLAAVICLPYLAVVGAGAAAVGRRERRLAPHAALAMVTMHCAWGLGFLRAAVASFTGRRTALPPPSAPIDPGPTPH